MNIHATDDSFVYDSLFGSIATAKALRDSAIMENKAN